MDEEKQLNLNDLPDNSAVDELIRSTHEELEKVDQMLAQPHAQPQAEPEAPAPAQDEPEAEEPARPHRLPAGIRALFYVVAVLAASVLLAIGAWICADDVLGLTAENREATVVVEEGDSMSVIAGKLKDAGIIEYPWLFRFYGWLSHADRKIDPGTYTLNAVYDYHAVVNGMISTSPNRDIVTITIPEGYTNEQIFSVLENAGVCAAAELEQAASDYAFPYDFLTGIPTGSPERLEGYLFPDTYEFYLDDAPELVLGRFLDNFERKYDETLRNRLEALNNTLQQKMLENGYTTQEAEALLLDQHDVIIIASMIEKETAAYSESARIASVIYNRLCSPEFRHLQIDATVEYALDERKDKLTVEDTQVDSPYNTYLYEGLPIGPISNPGLTSIEAALSPEQTDYYFYALYAEGNAHAFFATGEEHAAFVEEQGYGD